VFRGDLLFLQSLKKAVLQQLFETVFGGKKSFFFFIHPHWQGDHLKKTLNFIDLYLIF
jgi:hypothetical protein